MPVWIGLDDTMSEKQHMNEKAVYICRYAWPDQYSSSRKVWMRFRIQIAGHKHNFIEALMVSENKTALWIVWKLSSEEYQSNTLTSFTLNPTHPRFIQTFMPNSNTQFINMSYAAWDICLVCPTTVQHQLLNTINPIHPIHPSPNSINKKAISLQPSWDKIK